MKRYSLLIWAGLVSACAATTIAGCGDDDSADEPKPPREEDAGGDASRTLPARDAARADSEPDPPDTGASDTSVADVRTNDVDAPDADKDAGADADASAPNADASAPDASTPDAAPPIDAGDPSVCHPGTPGAITSLFPAGATVAGVKVGYSECAGAVTATANGGNDKDGRYAPNVKTGFEGRLTVTGLTFRRTTSGWIDSAVFGPPENLGVPLVAVGSGIAPYSDAKAHVLVILSGSGACVASGNTVAIDGHPEATVKYVDKTGATVAGGKTGSDGLVWISGIDYGGDATITVTPGVAGCRRDDGVYTGKLALLFDTVTTISVTLRP